MSDELRQLFDSGTEEIGVLAYAGLFLVEDASLQRILRKKAKAGVRVRILHGDPDDSHIAEHGREEGVGDAPTMKKKNPTATCRSLSLLPWLITVHAHPNTITGKNTR
jgi:hypothetical protein